MHRGKPIDYRAERPTFPDHQGRRCAELATTEHQIRAIINVPGAGGSRTPPAHPPACRRSSTPTSRPPLPGAMERVIRPHEPGRGRVPGPWRRRCAVGSMKPPRAGTNKIRHKMERAATLTKVLGTDVVDQGRGSRRSAPPLQPRGSGLHHHQHRHRRTGGGPRPQRPRHTRAPTMFQYM